MPHNSRGRALRDFDGLRDRVLVMGLDDWVPLLAVDMAAMKEGGTKKNGGMSS